MSQRDREWRKAKSYIGIHGKPVNEKIPESYIICPICKEVIDLKNRGNVCRIYFDDGRGNSAVPFKEARICPSCGIITTETGRVRYEKRSSE